MPDPTLPELMKMLTDAITAGQNPAGNTNIIPPLPDINQFEPTDDNSRISEWLDRFGFSLECSAPNAVDGAKVKSLMNKLSEQAFSEYSRSVMPSKVTDFTYKETTEKLEALFSRQQSIFVDRYNCLKAQRSEGEDFTSFVNRHRKLLRDFKFDELKLEQFKTLMLLTALRSPSDATLRQRILSKLTTDAATVNYDDVVKDLSNFMCTVAEAKIVETSANKNINAIQYKNKGKDNRGMNQKFNKNNANFSNQNANPCWRCGLSNHHHSTCTHKSTKCQKCNFKGHVDRQCEKVKQWRKENVKPGPNRNPGVRHITLGSTSLNNSPLLRITVKLNGKGVKLNLDTGSEANVIDETTHSSIGSPPVKKCQEKAKLFDGSLKPFIGKGKATFEFNGISFVDNFYLVKKGSLNLLSRQMMDKFGLLDELKQKINIAAVGIKTFGEDKKKNPPAAYKNEVDNLKEKFANVFNSKLGHCKKMKAHITLKEGVQPIYRRARPVPYNSKEVIDRELDRLENIGVIEKVEHSSWAAPILVVKKPDGSARLCIDYSTGLNSALEDHTHPLPVPDDIFATLNGGKIFSQIDLRDAYFQVELDEESQKICTIATHRGNYKMIRLPFGVKTAPAIFQSIMDAMLAGLEFATAYLDDIIIVSKSADEHILHLKEVLNRLENYGFRVKAEKCSFFGQSINYLGLIIDKNGRRPDPSKTKAITEMPRPTDVSTLRSYLGMINHYQQFVRNMRFIRKPLDDLLKKDTEFKWDQNCEKAFEKFKEILTSNLLLTHYDPKMEIIVSADASESGIGGVISHKFPDGTIKAIAHASSTLTPAEQNYSQIEKEGLALIFAVQKFHKMIYGRHFVLQTDHKPLLSIFGSKKGIRQCSANRLLRWSLILLAYDFSIEYVKTTEFGQADALSRLIANRDKGDQERVIASIGAELAMGSILCEAVQNIPIKFEEIVKASKQDETISKVMKFVQNGWPEEKLLEDEKTKMFHRRKAELSITQNCLMFSDRVVIPEKYQKQIMKMFHKGHPGINRMKQLARKYVYWPKMDNEIENFVRNCEPCQQAAKMPNKTNLHSWPKATEPWQRIHTDYAGPFFGKEYLIVVDAFSKYPEVFEMPTMSSAATIGKLRYLFSRHGIPQTLVSDNGTQYTSNEFTNFTKINGINHLFSAPYNPMSNGQAERFVDTFKRTFRKLKGEGAPSKEIIETLLVTYRTTPNDALEKGKSPAEAFLGRKPRTTLDLLIPPQAQPQERDDEMERNFNKRFGTKMRTFSLGDKVFARHRISQNWKAGTIRKCSGVIYDVGFLDGSSSRFHTNQIRIRHSADSVEDVLAVFNDTFNLPKPPVAPMNNGIEDQLEIPVENPIVEMEQGAEPVRREREQPQRNRRPPQRYSPRP